MDQVISLRKSYSFREIAYWILLSVEFFLREYYYNNYIGRISF
jgi:hypothetical protein